MIPHGKALVFDQETLSRVWDFQRQIRHALKQEHPDEYDLMFLDAQDRFEKWVR